MWSFPVAGFRRHRQTRHVSTTATAQTASAIPLRCTKGPLTPWRHGAREWVRYNSDTCLKSGGLECGRAYRGSRGERAVGRLDLFGGLDANEEYERGRIAERFTPNVDPRACLAPLPPQEP